MSYPFPEDLYLLRAKDVVAGVAIRRYTERLVVNQGVFESVAIDLSPCPNDMVRIVYGLGAVWGVGAAQRPLWAGVEHWGLGDIMATAGFGPQSDQAIPIATKWVGSESRTIIMLPGEWLKFALMYSVAAAHIDTVSAWGIELPRGNIQN